MSNNNYSVSEKEEKLHLYDQILSKLSSHNLLAGSAKYLSYFVAAATVYQITGGDTTSIAIVSPVLGRLIDQIGSDVLANILEKVANADKDSISEEDLRSILESELEKLNIKAPLTESEFYRAIRILSQRNEQQLKSLATQISEVSHQLRLLHPSERAALSIFPRTSRPLMIETPIIGREVELEWLSNIKNDSLVIGQPGTGKTFLLYQLILNGTAVFLNTSDSIEIRNALKIDVPQILIVDDAHISPEVLLDLRQVREQLRFDFIILATSWPGDKDLVADRLMLSSESIMELSRLNADQIVEIINHAGIEEPNSVIREIQEQADGRPGLALTLSEIYKKGGGIDVWQGKALRNNLLSYSRLSEIPAEDILGIFALGGMKGMPWNKVAEILEESPLVLKRYLANLSSAGLIFEVDSSHISVQPRALRYALLRDTFFTDKVQWWSLDTLIQYVPATFDTILEIMHAQSRGATVPQEWLQNQLKTQNSSELWMNYAALGEEQKDFVVRNYPDKVVQKSAWSLKLFPDLVLPLLFEAARDDSRELAPNPDHSLRIIQDWIRSSPPNTGEVTRRREALFLAIKNWVENGKISDVAIRAISILLSPRYDSSESDPGSGKSIILQFGLPGFNDLHNIFHFWPDALHCLTEMEISNWQPLQSLMWEWVFPKSVHQEVAKNIELWMRDCARKMLKDLVPLAGNRLGILHWLYQMSNELDLDLDIKLDEDFMILFPIEYRDKDEDSIINEIDAYRNEERRQINLALQLANDWKKTKPDVIARKIKHFELEATFANITWPRLTPQLCNRIANEVTNYNEWLRAFIDQKLDSDLIEPFFNLAAQHNKDYWIYFAAEGLEIKNTRYASITAILRYSNPAQPIFEKIYHQLGGYSRLIKTLCIWNQIPEATLFVLLQHENDEVVTAVAIGEWRTEPKGKVRKSLIQLWHEAILHRVPEDEHSLVEILSSDPELSKEWLNVKVEENSPIHSYKFRKTIPAAINSLDSELQEEYKTKFNL